MMAYITGPSLDAREPYMFLLSFILYLFNVEGKGIVVWE